MKARPTARARPVLRGGAARLTAAASALVLVLSGCGSSHSSTRTAAAKASPYVLLAVRNDTPSAVRFLQCLATCSQLHERQTIAAGGRTAVIVQNDGTRFGYLVEDAAGRRLGCIYRKFEAITRQPTVLISSMGACE